MSLQEITEKSTINFARRLNLEEVEKLIYCIAEKLPANINYHISRHKSLYHGEKGAVLKNGGTVVVSGTISSLRNPGAFDSFQTKPSENYISLSSAIAFSMVPGWELEDYRPEVQELWNDVRKIVNKYL